MQPSNLNPKKFYVYSRTLHQFAEGILGQHKYASIHTGPNGEGYALRQEAVEKLKELKSDGRFKNSEKKWSVAKVLSGKKLIELREHWYEKSFPCKFYAN